MALPDHASFKQPADPSVLAWRYMELPQLLSLLMRRALHLTRLDNLEDKFEGSLPLHTRREWEAEMRRALESPAAGPLMEEFLRYFSRLLASGATSAKPDSSPVVFEVFELFRQLMRMGRALAIVRAEKETGAPVSESDATRKIPVRVEPFAYLSWLFERLPHLKSVEDFEAVLPWNAPAPTRG